MQNEFLRFFNENAESFPMHLGICYNKTCDWCIEVYKVGCADDFPKSIRHGDNAIIVNVNDSDMELCFAKAYVQMKEWLLENVGGY